MPRSGTVYFSKFLSLLFDFESVQPVFTGGFRPKSPEWDPYQIDKSFLSLRDRQILTAHYHLDANLLDFIVDRSVLAMYLYRDPRDVAVSAAIYIKYGLTHHVLHKKFSKMSDRDAITFYINGGRVEADLLPDDMIADGSDYIYHDGISYFTTAALRWTSCPDVLCIKYEDFFSDPHVIVSKLNDCGVKVASHDIDRIIAIHNFQKSSSRPVGSEDKFSHFRKGISGDHKNYFDEKMNCLVENLIGPHLRALGYQ